MPDSKTGEDRGVIVCAAANYFCDENCVPVLNVINTLIEGTLSRRDIDDLSQRINGLESGIFISFKWPSTKGVVEVRFHHDHGAGCTDVVVDTGDALTNAKLDAALLIAHGYALVALSDYVAWQAHVRGTPLDA